MEKFVPLPYKLYNRTKELPFNDLWGDLEFIKLLDNELTKQYNNLNENVKQGQTKSRVSVIPVIRDEKRGLLLSW